MQLYDYKEWLKNAINAAGITNGEDLCNYIMDTLCRADHIIHDDADVWVLANISILPDIIDEYGIEPCYDTDISRLIEHPSEVPQYEWNYWDYMLVRYTWDNMTYDDKVEWFGEENAQI